MNWLQQVTQMFQENEAPEKFFYWAAMSALSAVVKKQVVLDRYQYKLYPNIYVLIMGKSGIKKGLPISTAKSLIEKVSNTRIISGRKSVPRVIQDLGKAYTIEGGGIVHEAQGILISGEFAAFLVKDIDALTILTDLYDTHNHEKFWENSLKGTGVDKLKSPCLTLLGATNEEHFADAVPTNAIGGGFIARSFIVLGTERGNLNSLTERPKALPDISQLADYLKKVSQVQGEFKWTAKGKELYDAWYYDFYNRKYHDPTGTMNRLGDSILKASMLVSLSRDLSLELHQEDIFEAITVCEECISGMMQVTMGSGGQTLAQSTKIVMRELIINPTHQVKKSDLLKKYWGQFDDWDIQRIAETLQASNAIEITPCGKGDMVYKMTKNTLEMYTNFKKGIQ